MGIRRSSSRSPRSSAQLLHKKRGLHATVPEITRDEPVDNSKATVTDKEPTKIIIDESRTIRTCMMPFKNMRKCTCEFKYYVTKQGCIVKERLL
jgi:hypothetical protein